MNIREEIKNYKLLVKDIELYETEIKLLEKELESLEYEPNITQVINGMPFVHSQSSKTETAAIRKAELKPIRSGEIKVEIEGRKLQKELAERKKEVIDNLISRLTEEEQDYMTYYTDGTSYYTLSEKYYIEPETVKNKISLLLRKVENDYIRRNYKVS